MNTLNNEVEVLIEKLPEQYQQIFSYSKYDSLGSRKCDSRLKEILDVYNQIKKQLGRDLKVLDLGCAQGYFSLNLAKEEAFVCGVDCNQENINLCNKLSNIHNLNNLEFKKDKIQNFLKSNPLQEYDLILGLSVFHHICYEEGYEFTKNLIQETSKVIPNGIFELALKSEPMYWAESLEENEKDLIDCYSFTNQISKVETHLSEVKRPIFFVSNKIFLMESFATNFDVVLSSPHDFEDNAHNGTRKYFISTDLIIKYLSFQKEKNRLLNKKEFKYEINFLENEVVIKNKPKVVFSFANKEFGVIAREKIDGVLLHKRIKDLSFKDKKKLVLHLISQLVILEENNLYHNDLRVWNLIIDHTNEVSLIDYGAITESSNDCVWPSNVFYSFIVLVVEIFSEDFSHNNPTRKLDITKLYQLKELQHSVTRILTEKPENLSFKFIQQIFLDSYEKNNETDFNRITYEQNLSLNLHIEKLNQVKRVLNGLVFGEEIINLKIDSLLKEIQELFSKKNNHITSIEKVNYDLEKSLNLRIEKLNRVKRVLNGLVFGEEIINLKIDSLLKKIQELFSKKNNHITWMEKVNNDLEEKNIKIKIKLDSLRDRYEKIIIENNNMLIINNGILSENDELNTMISSKNDEINKLIKINSILYNKIYDVSFTKHLYRAYKKLFKQGKFK